MVEHCVCKNVVIISLNSDSDSALPTLCLKLVFELCLSDLHFVLLKLHMDLHASDSVLHILINKKMYSLNIAIQLWIKTSAKYVNVM